jgi:cytochrome oxidase Cu insertion factor (SCO1/SenC/PrrC family)
MRRSRKLLVVLLVLVAVLGVVVWRMLRVPPPQIASNAGHAASDFTLTDQNGQPFHLADQRGHKVVLVFYRGYW